MTALTGLSGGMYCLREKPWVLSPVPQKRTEGSQAQCPTLVIQHRGGQGPRIATSLQPAGTGYTSLATRVQSL